MKSTVSEVAALESFLSRHPQSLTGSGPAVVFRALPGAYLRTLADRQPVRCVQTLKPLADELARLGFEPAAETLARAGLAVVFATKHKEEVFYHFALAAELLEEGGSLVVSAANDLGAASLERRCAEVFGEVQSYSKHKCRVFRTTKDSSRLDRAQLDAWRRGGELQVVPATGLWSRPGLFSWKSFDAGSRLLASHLPDDLAGRGADLGAGYGYLAREILARSPCVEELHLYETERKALEAAEQNLAALAGSTALRFHWADVAAGLPVRGLDFVVTNPPFHAGREAIPALGRAFVRAALAALKPGGRLFLVANRHLPYEAEIATQGGRLENSDEGLGFKVIFASKTG